MLLPIGVPAPMVMINPVIIGLVKWATVSVHGTTVAHTRAAHTHVCNVGSAARKACADMCESSCLLGGYRHRCRVPAAAAPCIGVVLNHDRIPHTAAYSE